MFRKALLLTAFGAGYVLGAHAGRERYEQIRKVALRVKEDPHVQKAVEDIAEVAKDQGAAVAHKVSGQHNGASVPTQPPSPDVETGVPL